MQCYRNGIAVQFSDLLKSQADMASDFGGGSWGQALLRITLTNFLFSFIISRSYERKIYCQTL